MDGLLKSYQTNSDPQAPLSGLVGDYIPIEMDLISDAADRALFKQYIHRYHCLGYRVPFAVQLRYFVSSRHFPERILPCLFFTRAAWKMAPRDRWIGSNDSARRCNLPRVVNDSRFLILPCVQVHNLASTILSLVTQQIQEGRLSVYQVQPLHLESLADTARFAVTKRPIGFASAPHKDASAKMMTYTCPWTPTHKQMAVPTSIDPRLLLPRKCSAMSPFQLKRYLFAAGKMQTIVAKTPAHSLYWKKVGHDKVHMLVVIKPLGCRLRQGSKLLYREPAFLICTDPDRSSSNPR